MTNTICVTAWMIFFELINEGTVVSICDDLETFCDELGIEMEDVTIAEAE